MSDGGQLAPPGTAIPASMRAKLLTQTQGESGYCVCCIDWYDCSSDWCPSADTDKQLNEAQHPWRVSTEASPPQRHGGSN